MKDCGKCEKRSTCKELCEENLKYVNTGYNPGREKPVSQLNWAAPEDDDSSSADYFEYHVIDPTSAIVRHTRTEEEGYENLRRIRTDLAKIEGLSDLGLAAGILLTSTIVPIGHFTMAGLEELFCSSRSTRVLDYHTKKVKKLINE